MIRRFIKYKFNSFHRNLMESTKDRWILNYWVSLIPPAMRLLYYIVFMKWFFDCLDILYDALFFTVGLPIALFNLAFSPIIEYHNYIFDVVMGLRKRQSYWHFLNPISYCVFALVGIFMFMGFHVITLTLFFIYNLIVRSYKKELSLEYIEQYIQFDFDAYIKNRAYRRA